MFDVLADEATSDEDLIDLGFDEALDFDKESKAKGAKRGSLKRQPPSPTMMPPFHSEFWNVYGNKLRVNGTAEGVCHMIAAG